MIEAIHKNNVTCVHTDVLHIRRESSILINNVNSFCIFLMYHKPTNLQQWAYGEGNGAVTIIIVVSGADSIL